MSLNIFSYIFPNCLKLLGELVDIGSSQAPISFLSCLVCLASMGIYVLLQEGEGNDDDDSDSGGGGLMQPVS